MCSSDSGINASLTLAKVYKRIRAISPGYKSSSRYQARLKHRLATRRMKRGIIR
jgi:hypothetical protein